MPKNQILLGFFLASSATACPIQAGYMANGQIVDTVHLIPVCGTLPSEMKTLPESTKWSEIYAFSPTKTNDIKLVSIKASLRKNGYTQFRESKNESNEIYQFSKGNQYIVLSTFTYKGARFLRVAGS